MATVEERLGVLAKTHKEKVEALNTAVHSGTAAQVTALTDEIKKLEKDYKVLAEKKLYTSITSPRALVLQRDFPVISNSRVMSEGTFVGYQVSEKRVPVNMKLFCELHELPLDWWYETQALNKRMTLAIAQNLGLSAAALKEIDNSYAMEKLASEISLGKTPTSNTQIVRHIQRVFDLLIPEESGKVNTHDLEYIRSGYTKISRKENLSVICGKHSLMMSLLTDVFYHILTNTAYGVDYKRSKSAGSAKPAAKTAKSPAKTAKSPAKSSAKPAKTAKTAKSRAKTPATEKVAA